VREQTHALVDFPIVIHIRSM